MGTLMVVGVGELGKVARGASCLFLALPFTLAQNTSHTFAGPGSAQSTRALLADKAHVLEARGRPDLSVQIWQQILLSDPKNVDALAGMAKDLKLTGSDKSVAALENLRKVSPNNPDISRIQSISSTRAESEQLHEASDLARQGRADDAVHIYKQLYGDHPPDGDIALGYYQTLYATASGKQEAISGMRALAARNTGDPRYSVELGKMLTFEPRTRIEGIRILKQHPNDLNAQAALRQALLWDAQNPAAAGEVRAYLKEHPEDTELAARVKPGNSARQDSAAKPGGPAQQGKPAAAQQCPAVVRASVRPRPRPPAPIAHPAALTPAHPAAPLAAAPKPDTRLEDAAALMKAGHYDQAAARYADFLAGNPSSVSAWTGLVSAHHALNQNAEALADVKRMPAPAYDSAVANADFLAALGAVYLDANQPKVAQDLLERAAKLQSAAGGQPAVAVQLQLASIYLSQGDAAKAGDLYRQVLAADSSRADAWKGLIAALVATHRSGEALDELAIIPDPARSSLDDDIGFVQSEASLYAAAGDSDRAIDAMSRLQARYARLHTPMPIALEIENAQLQFNVSDDRALYRALMRMGNRSGLTNDQRQTVQQIWADWAVRRSVAAMEAGNAQRAVDILDAASQAFPDNLTARKAVAGGYLEVGRSRESLAVYKSISMDDAAASDFQGAVGAALAANDKSQAEQWVRMALQRFPSDPAVLTLAARYEQARGHNQRAAEYYRDALAAMPPASRLPLPADKLARLLASPDDAAIHRAATAADLQRLLDPDCEQQVRESMERNDKSNSTARPPACNCAAPSVILPGTKP
jgi:tetratricopeptide (TPR) repeat protein